MSSLNYDITSSTNVRMYRREDKEFPFLAS